MALGRPTLSKSCCIQSICTLTRQPAFSASRKPPNQADTALQRKVRPALTWAALLAVEAFLVAGHGKARNFKAGSGARDFAARTGTVAALVLRQRSFPPIRLNATI
ncbi:hypothetical protein WJX84_007652 [Apatococcus fuscideae]|uniref:Uncharacterized protein n=1 Tax=Apatococcus fuscideae TaxID=2026836 RepID=A0AAW1RE52_9CHLO